MVGHTSVEAVPHQLELMLQHSDITTTWSSVCRLLCVSKGVQHTVVSTSTCQLAVTLGEHWSEAKARSFAGFVRRFGKLVVNLAHHAAPKPVTTALMCAALQSQGLQIRSLTSHVPSSPLMCLLPLLHKTLTRLELAFASCWYDDAARLSDAAELALSQLSNLRSLKIEQEVSGIQKLGRRLSAVSEFTSLTTLTVLEVMPRDLSHLPMQLQELHFSYFPDHYCNLKEYAAQAGNHARYYTTTAPVALQLMHLTALTKLGSARLTNWSKISSRGYVMTHGIPWSDGEEGHTLQLYDVFPSSLRQATFLDIQSVQPLLHLTNLQDLSVLSASTPARELLQLGAVSSLTAVSICYAGGSSHHTGPVQQGSMVAAAIHAMSALPLACLHLRRNHLPLDAASALGGLTALTALTLDGSSEVCAAAKEIAAALSQLTRLQHLSLGIAEANVDTPEDDRNSLGSEQGPLDDYESGSEQGPLKFYESESDSIDSLLSRGYRTSRHHSAEEQCRTMPKLPEDNVLLICEVFQELKQLRSLSILFNPVTADAARQLQKLGTATQLTLLRLDACLLTDGTIASLLGSLPSGLKQLDLGGETVVGEECLAVVGQGLPHLTELEMGWLPLCH